GAEHEERAVRQVRDAHQPEDQREPGREQEQEAAERDAVDTEDDPLGHARRSSSLPIFILPPLAGGGRRGALSARSIRAPYRTPAAPTLPSPASGGGILMGRCMRWRPSDLAAGVAIPDSSPAGSRASTPPARETLS